jgi:hypothetical protein
MKVKTVVLGFSLSFFMTTLAINGCTQAPTTSNNSTTSTQSIGVEGSAAFSSMYENEELFKDSETVAGKKSDFNTKALINTTIDTTLNTEIKDRIANLASKLQVKTDVSADLIASIGRTNFTVKASDVVSTSNSDGSTTKTVAVEFTNKETGKVKSDTVSKTYLKNGDTKLEHYLTVNIGTYNKAATRKKMTSNNQVTVETQSKATLSNGSTIEIQETRNKSNGAEGSGTIIIKPSSGEATTYTFDSKVDADGKLIVDAKNTAKSTEVKLTQKTEATATAEITSNNKTDTSELNTETASEAAVSTSSK